VPRTLAVATDENPSLQTLWQYALRFCVEVFLDSKSGAFELADSRLRSTDALEQLLYLVAAVALLYATTQGVSVQLALFASTG